VLMQAVDKASDQTSVGVSSGGWALQVQRACRRIGARWSQHKALHRRRSPSTKRMTLQGALR
jgi:hypothetical protein